MGFCGLTSTPEAKAVRRKIVILGDGACGKTSLLNVFTRGFFPEVYEPTVFENYVHDIYVDGQHIVLSLWDTAGQEEFDRLRTLSYADTHVIMLCFSVESRDSLENVQEKWWDEIARHCDGVKLVLVALKCDLRDDEVTKERLDKFGEKCISYEQGLTMAKTIKAVRYLECSAKHNRGVLEAFTEASRVSLTARPVGGDPHEDQKPSGRCVIL